MDNKVISITELCKVTGFTRSQVNWAINQKWLKADRIGRTFMIKYEDVVRWLLKDNLATVLKLYGDDSLDAVKMVIEEIKEVEL